MYEASRANSQNEGNRGRKKIQKGSGKNRQGAFESVCDLGKDKIERASEKKKYILIRPKEQMKYGIAVYILDEKGKRPLPHICRHSLDGYQLGYCGSGPHDLGLSICTLFGMEEVYQQFTKSFIATLNPNTDYDLSFDAIRAMLKKLKK